MSKDILILEAIIQNEKSLAELYYRYSLQFTNIEFWQKLSREEEYHASLLVTLFEEYGAPVIKEKNKFHEIKTLASLIEHDISFVNQTTLKEALEQAFRYEKLLLESHVFDIFSSSTPSVLKIIDRIRSETDEHLLALIQEINNN